MKKLKKVIALAVGAVMTSSLLAGCSTNGLALYKTFKKSQEITSMESKTDISVNVSANNVSNITPEIQTMLGMINSSKISSVTKTNMNKDNTAGKVYMDMKLQSQAMPMEMALWVDTDVSGDKLKFKEVIKMPQMVTAQIPQMNGKEYLVMDQSSIQGMEGMDYNKLMSLGKDFEPKLNAFVEDYIKQYNPKLNVINNLGKKDITVAGKTQKANVYQLKLNDRTLKDLMRYTVNNLAENKANTNKFLKDYLELIAAVMPTEGMEGMNFNVDEMIKEFENGLPEMISGLNKGLDSIKDIKILGDKGISVEFAINNDGYIVNQKGSMEFVINLANFNKVAGNEAANMAGTYTITVNFNTDTYNINEKVEVVLPETNASNSVNFLELMPPVTEEDNNEKVEEEKDNGKGDVDSLYKKAFNSVNNVVTLANQNDVKPFYFKSEGSLEVGATSTENVVNAAAMGIQGKIDSARGLINALPDSIKTQKETLSSILDNYQHPIYERVIYIINNNKENPKQNEVIWGRILINDINPVYKNSYSVELDKLQQAILDNAGKLVDKAATSKVQEDIDAANKSIAELKEIPSGYMTTEISNFINALETKLK